MLKLQEDLFKRRREMRQHFDELEIEEDFDDIPEAFDREVNEELHKKNVDRLNLKQRQVFDSVVNAINNGKVVRQIVLGTAGVGKSALIDAIADELTIQNTDPQDRLHHPSVAIAAPTGIAALNIRGNTLHSLFAVQVQKGKDMSFKELRRDKLEQLQEYFSKCKLLIIDEVSMCSNVLLTIVSHSKLFFL